MLDRVVRRGIDRHPGATFIISRRDEQIPVASKSGALKTAGRICAEETTSRTPLTATHRLRKNRVDDTLASANIDIANPANRRAVSLANRDVNVSLGSAR